MKLILVLIGFIVSCSSSHDQKTIRDTKTQSLSAQELLENPESIIFDDVYNLVLEPSCLKCHGAGKRTESNVDLTKFENLTDETSYKKVVNSGLPEESLLFKTLIASGRQKMPPPNLGLDLNEDQINLVNLWILNGAKTKRTQEKKETDKTLAEVLNPYFLEPQTIDYTLIKKHVFDHACTSCHSNEASNPDFEAITFGQDMTTYKSLFKDENNKFSVAGIVKGVLTDQIKRNEDGEFEKIEGGLIYKSVAITQSMPPMNQGYEPLDSLRVKLLRLWILNCAIEDYEALKNNDSLDEGSVTKNREKVRICNNR